MLSRIIGAVVILAGMVLVLAGALKGITTPSTARLLTAEGTVLHSSLWSMYSYLWSAGITILGAALVGSGIGIVRGSRESYLALAATFLCLSACSSVLSETRVMQYLFYSSSVHQSAGYMLAGFVIVSFAAFVAFLITQQGKGPPQSVKSVRQPDESASAEILIEGGGLYSWQGLACLLFWIATAGLVAFCVTFGLPLIARFPAVKLVEWAGCKPHGWDVLGHCPAGSFAESFLPLTNVFYAVVAPITLLQHFGGTLLIWASTCVILGFTWKKLKKRSARRSSAVSQYSKLL